MDKNVIIAWQPVTWAGFIELSILRVLPFNQKLLARAHLSARPNWLKGIEMDEE